nr:type II toxin-antitoxin system HicB family antitoxin [Aurantimonas sp. 22II-16-19i]
MIAPLTEADGGGYVAYIPDLQGCMSDGESPEEALANLRDAYSEWIDTYEKLGREVPKPGTYGRAMQAKSREIADRFEKLDAEVKDLQEKAEHFSAWLRFSELTGVDPGGPLPPEFVSKTC